jgi:hypothetical protein
MEKISYLSLRELKNLNLNLCLNWHQNLVVVAQCEAKLVLLLGNVELGLGMSKSAQM